jgi:hypothetical protein
VVPLGDAHDLLGDGDCRYFPPALVHPSLAPSCSGELLDFIKSPADFRAVAALYFSGDARLAAEMALRLLARYLNRPALPFCEWPPKFIRPGRLP